MWSIGVADIATLNQPFVALVASILPFEAIPSHFFAVFDSLGVITTHLGAPNSRSGRFRVNDDDDDDDNDNNNRRTKRLLNPLLRMRARGNQRVAVKHIHQDILYNSAIVDEFKREVRVESIHDSGGGVWRTKLSNFGSANFLKQAKSFEVRAIVYILCAGNVPPGRSQVPDATPNDQM